MECRDVLEATITRLVDELPDGPRSELDRHLAACPRCASEARAIESAWTRLGDDPDAVPSAAWSAKTLAVLEAETRKKLDSRVVAFRPHRTWAIALRVAAVLVAGVTGFFLARITGSAGESKSGFPSLASGTPSVELLPVSSQRTVDVSRTVPDLKSRPRLANVAYEPADPEGRIRLSFDVNTRYTLVGKPEEKGIADVLAYLVSGAAGTEGARGRAIDLVSRHAAEGVAASPQIVSVLTETLKKDRNPGVRKKAAEALVALPPSRETQLAFTAALKNDGNPAIRILAVEGLAKAARELKDPASIETLRQKAGDELENGYVRTQAALALKGIQM